MNTPRLRSSLLPRRALTVIALLSATPCLADFRLVGVLPVRWAQGPGSVGFVGGTQVDFESPALPTGLLVEWQSPNGNVGPTATLPALFANATGDPFGSAFSTGAWDGTRSLISGRGNSSHVYSNPANWGDLLLHFNPPVKFVGFSIQQADLEVNVFINGVSQGGLFAGTAMNQGGGRNGYALIEARGADSISTIKLDNTGGDGFCIDMLMFSTAPSPLVDVVGFAPGIWPRPDADVGFPSSPPAEDFEDAQLTPGLTIAWDTQAGQFGPTATLPALFAPVTDDPFGNAFDLGPWDGSRCVINTRDNQSHAYSGTPEWGDIDFRFDPPVFSVGFSLTNMFLPSRLVVNGRDVGDTLTLASLSTSSGRNGYLRVDGVCGQAIHSLRINNDRPASGGDGFAIDHLLVNGVGCDCIDFNRDGVFPDLVDVVTFLDVFSGGPCPTDPPVGAGCGDLDFNNDGVFPDLQDIIKFFEVFGGGNC